MGLPLWDRNPAAFQSCHGACCNIHCLQQAPFGCLQSKGASSLVISQGVTIKLSDIRNTSFEPR